MTGHIELNTREIDFILDLTADLMSRLEEGKASPPLLTPKELIKLENKLIDLERKLTSKNNP